MKRNRNVWTVMAALLAVGGALAQQAKGQAAPAASAAQAKAPTDSQEMAKLGTVVSPVSGMIKTQLPRFSKNMVAAAEAMPAEKYGFKPTPEMNSFGHLVMHIAQSNNGLCSKISGMDAPDVKLLDTDPKDKLVEALKASFDYCAKVLEKVDDSKLGDQMMLFGNRPFSRAGVLIILSDDWYDHYGAQAIYLRLNGILPPTAQPAQPPKQ
ncbi:MAG TPA: DinB family protein [Methylomirabilota bacterium]|nr:DinB family protein [Methylomirabilota bacterium]